MAQWKAKLVIIVGEQLNNMGIGQTGRFLEGDIKTTINAIVRQYDRRKKAKSRNSFVNLLQATSTCSKCERKMQKRIADIQIENKRENAPICIPCIMGNKRKEKPIDRISLLPIHVKKEFRKYRQQYKPKKW